MVSELGDVLELLFGAVERTPAMSGVYVQTAHPAAVGEARRLGAGMPVPFGALSEPPDSVLPTARDVSYEVLVDGPRWRTRRVADSDSNPTMPGDLVSAGFDGTVGWRTGSPGMPPPSVNPLARLLDPTWVLHNRSLTIGQSSTVLDRPAVTAIAEIRTVGRTGAVPGALTGAPTATLAIDTEFGFLLSCDQSRDGRLVRGERFLSLHIGDPAAREHAAYQPPTGATLSDDAEDTWAKLPGWKRRLATAAPLAAGAWRVLRGKPMMPTPDWLRPQAPPKMR